MAVLTVDQRFGRPLSTAKAYLVLKRRTAREFARYHGKSEAWIYTVLNGRAQAPESFKDDLSAFLQVPREDLFPADGEGASWQLP